VRLRLGIDVACRAAHQASLADERGEFVWTARSFRTTARELERLWAMLPGEFEPTDVTVIMEPTRNAWVALAAWFRRRGATVVLVPPERAADLRAYYAKHTKSDRLDSRLLARLPLLHPDGLHPERGLGPGDALRRATKLHSTLVLRRGKSLARLDALLEILGPGWHEAFRGDLANKTPLRFLAAGYADPDTVRRLGRARLGRFGSPATLVACGARPRLTSSWPRQPRRMPSGLGSWTTPIWPRTSRSRRDWRSA
jgi:transposase